MVQELQSDLWKAGASTFEELGFLFVESHLTREQADAPITWRASVQFTGPVVGKLDVGFSSALADELAANMLGAPAPIAGDLTRDALGEIANVVCGNLVPSLGRADDVFHLGPPTVQSVPHPGVEWPGAAVRVTIGAGDGRAELALHLGEDASREPGE